MSDIRPNQVYQNKNQDHNPFSSCNYAVILDCRNNTNGILFVQYKLIHWNLGGNNERWCLGVLDWSCTQEQFDCQYILCKNQDILEAMKQDLSITISNNISDTIQTEENIKYSQKLTAIEQLEV